LMIKSVNKKKFSIICFLLLFPIVLQFASVCDAKSRSVQNVIFLIGDGMGLTQVFASRATVVGPDGSLNVDRMPFTGFVRTHSANSLITDSAAAATALASGFKTDNGMIGVTPDSQRVQTILSACQRAGKSTGLIATSSITHATPACFAAHVISRSSESQIAEQIIDDKIDVLLGGGKSFFIPSTESYSKRSDDKNLIATAQNNGYIFIQTRDELLAANSNRLVGLFENEAMTTEPPEPTLAEMAGKALEILSRNPKGFFIMIEGSQIDWAAHAHNKDNLVKQVTDFDKAVKIALDFAAQHHNTLVVVTADHETGGLAIINGQRTGAQLDFAWSTEGHSATMVPVYAYGPGASRFSGTLDNTDIPKIMAELAGINNFPAMF
jgi:alkaline phosphatase